MGARRAAWGWIRNVNRSWSQFFHLFTKASAHHNSLWKIWTSNTSNYKFTWIGAQILSWKVNYHSSPPLPPSPTNQREGSTYFFCLKLWPLFIYQISFTKISKSWYLLFPQNLSHVLERRADNYKRRIGFLYIKVCPRTQLCPKIIWIIL